MVHVVESAGPDLGAVVFTRACAGEAEARTFASTVNQHLHWLSEAKFRARLRELPNGTFRHRSYLEYEDKIYVGVLAMTKQADELIFEGQPLFTNGLNTSSRRHGRGPHPARVAGLQNNCEENLHPPRRL